MDIGAPGVWLSTVVEQGYTDIVIDKFGFKATWDGTSMATPHVAGGCGFVLVRSPTEILARSESGDPGLCSKNHLLWRINLCQVAN